jgi:hypothetical protein
MKTLLVCLAGVVITGSALAREDLRSWTNQEGTTITASLTGVEGDQITLRLDNGQTYTIDVATVSTADQEFVAQWQKQQEMQAAWERFDLQLGAPTEPIVESKFDSETPTTGKGGMIGEWKAGIGEWRVEDGSLVGDELEADNHASSLTHEVEGTHLILTAQVKLGTAEQIAFACRDNVPPSLHLGRLYITPDKLWIQRMTGISKTTTAEKLTTVDVEIDPEEWYDVTIEIIGDRYRAKVGDEELEAQHERFADHFRDVSIWKAAPKDES